MAAQKNFNPNRLTFEQGLQRIQDAIGKRSFPKIVTSQDDGIDSIVKELEVTNIPAGFVKYQLPVAIQGGPGIQFFISVGQPRTSVTEHSHDEGDGMRFIVSGSIKYGDKELRAGDWMYIPKGSKYSFDVGDQGSTIFYCYSCCCAQSIYGYLKSKYEYDLLSGHILAVIDGSVIYLQ